VVPEEALVLKGYKKEEFEYSKYLLLGASFRGENNEPDIHIPPIRYIRK